jgi:hypothetical protein
MKSKNLEWVGIVLITIIGVIHLILMRGEYDEAHYMGMLFAANFVGAIIAAVGIYRGSLWGWILGFLVAAGSVLGYVLSRTIGLPGMEIEEWLDPYGMLSLLMEIVFIALLVQKAPWKEAVQNASK